MKLTEEDILKLGKIREVRLVSLSFGKYYVKTAEIKESLMELLGKKIADIFNINAPNIKVIKKSEIYYYITNKCYILSEDLNKFGTFKTIHEILPNDNTYDTSFYDIWNFIEANSQLNISMLDVVKIYIIDIIFSHNDRNTLNWGILFSKNGLNQVTIFDNEFLMEVPDSVSLYTSKKSDLYEDLKRFFIESSKEYILLFKKYYDLLTPTFIKQTLDKLCMENDIIYDTENLIHDYQEHYEKIGQIYQERGEYNAR